MPDSAAQDDEQDFSIPGSDEADQGGIAGAPQNGAPDPQAAPPQAQATQPAAPQPQVSGRTAFLGNLLKAVMSGIQNAPGNPNNAFDRGYMANSPNAQAQQKAQQQQQSANLQHTLSENDLIKQQVAMTGANALSAEYNLKRLPIEDQLKHMDVISKFKDNLIKNGASIEVEGDDEKASDAQAMRMNSADPRSTQHEGRFYSLPTVKSDGTPKFDVVYVPSKDTLQQDFKYTDSEGEEQSIPAGTPMYGAMGKIVENVKKGTQNDLKEQHKAMADALSPKVPDGDIPQTVGWLKNQKDQNTPLYQQNKNAVDAQINMLNAARGQINSDKLAQARAGVEMRQDEKEKGGLKAGEDALNYAQNYISSKQYTGPGDEALLEKFFELAKPTSGFRMTQSQIELLQKGRSWIESAKGQAGHVEGGTLFSEKQREQIAGTMKMLAQSKGGGKSGAVPQRPSGVPAQAVWNPESRQWRLPQ